MARQRLTIDDARQMQFTDLIEAGYQLLGRYEAPEAETPAELDARISRTLDELPDIYGWFNQLHAYFSHWSDAYATMFGNGNIEYKEYRQKRDAMEKLASSCKLRYEATSRRLTQILASREESSMPRGR